MRTLLVLTAIVALVFAVPLVLVPEALGSIFGVKYDPAGALTSRVLGGAWLGYAILNWNAREAPAVSQRNVLVVDLAQAAVGFVVTALGAASGIGSTLLWFWPALFLVFGIAQAYFVWMVPREAAASRA